MMSFPTLTRFFMENENYTVAGRCEFYLLINQNIILLAALVHNISLNTEE